MPGEGRPEAEEVGEVEEVEEVEEAEGATTGRRRATEAVPETPPRPGARQLLHWATGDREAEAEALADAASGEVDEEDAEVAVKRAHGDLGDEEPRTPSDVASPADAEEAHQERRADER